MNNCEISYINYYKSPIGDILMESDGTALTRMVFTNDSTDSIKSISHNDLKIFSKTSSWLDIYFSGEAPDFMPKLKIEGTDFKINVWKELLKISYGKTASYGEISKKIYGSINYSRPVGRAVGDNPICLIIPCHRVIGSKGSLIGYAWGLDKKEYLLKLEGIL